MTRPPVLGLDVAACARQAVDHAAAQLRAWSPALGAPAADPGREPALTPLGAIVHRLAGWLDSPSVTGDDIAQAEADHLAFVAFPWPTARFSQEITLCPLGDLHGAAFAKIALLSDRWADRVEVAPVARLGGAAPGALHAWIESQRRPGDDAFLGERGMPRPWAARWLAERGVPWAARAAP